MSTQRVTQVLFKVCYWVWNLSQRDILDRIKGNVTLVNEKDKVKL